MHAVIGCALRLQVFHDTSAPILPRRAIALLKHVPTAHTKHCRVAWILQSRKAMPVRPQGFILTAELQGALAAVLGLKGAPTPQTLLVKVRK